MSLIDQAKEFRKEVEATKRATGKLILKSDISKEELQDLMSVYPAFEVGVSLKVGDIVRYQNKLYEVVQAHTTQSDWTPEKVPALFKIFEVKKDSAGNEVVAEFKHPTGAHDSYKKGDKVQFKGAIYESLIDNNAYSPEEYAQGWKKIN